MVALLMILPGTSAIAADSAPWKIAMEPAGKVKANFPSNVSVRIQDEKNKPVTDAEVEIVLTMVEMDHGEFKTPAKMTKPGVYEGAPNFFMVGKWNVTVRAKKGDQSATKVFPYEVKE